MKKSNQYNLPRKKTDNGALPFNWNIYKVRLSPINFPNFIFQEMIGTFFHPETVLSKQGISIGGLATGEYLKSDFSGSATDNSLRTTEPVTYTQVDFDLRARPNALTTARAVFRLHEDWPNFWGSPSTPRGGCGPTRWGPVEAMRSTSSSAERTTAGRWRPMGRTTAVRTSPTMWPAMGSRPPPSGGIPPSHLPG